MNRVLESTAGDLTADEAREMLGRARQHWSVLTTIATKLYSGRAWLALGYTSWDEMCESELGGTISLPRADRRAAHIEMGERGMSTRAIAAVTGVDHSTVVRHLNSGGAVAPPNPAADRPSIAPSDDEPVAAPVESHPQDSGPATDNVIVDAADRFGVDEPSRTVTGIDGKNYTVKPKPRRWPLTNTANSLRGDIWDIPQRVRALIDDDRFLDNEDDLRKIFPADLLVEIECALTELGQWLYRPKNSDVYRGLMADRTTRSSTS